MQTAEDGPSMTECNEQQLEFHALGKREVIGKFDGGAISSDGGALLLSEVEAKTHIADSLCSCSGESERRYASSSRLRSWSFRCIPAAESALCKNSEAV
jgi:hypothetical protein